MPKSRSVFALGYGKEYELNGSWMFPGHNNVLRLYCKDCQSGKFRIDGFYDTRYTIRLSEIVEEIWGGDSVVRRTCCSGSRLGWVPSTYTGCLITTFNFSMRGIWCPLCPSWVHAQGVHTGKDVHRHTLNKQTFQNRREIKIDFSTKVLRKILACVVIWEIMKKDFF